MTSGAPVTLTEHAIQQLLSSAGLLEQYAHAERNAACEALTRRQKHAPLDGEVRSGAVDCKRLRVTADCWKSVNGRPFQRWCDPAIALDGSNSSAISQRGRPRWMLPRIRGSAAEVAAQRAAKEWRARGYVVEAFVGAPARPASWDRVLPSSGYREVAVLCVHGRIALSRGEASSSPPVEQYLIESVLQPLQIGAWHAIRNAHHAAVSWLYVMR